MNLINEFDLNNAYQNRILPFFEHVMQRGVWHHCSDIKIVYYSAFCDNAKGLIVLSTGRVESARKYAELLYDLYHNGYSVFIHDHRGQGESSRISDNHHHGHIEVFSDYVTDFGSIIDDVISPLVTQNQHQQVPRYLLCHSMGAAIGALLLKTRESFFSKVVFCSPMFGIASPVPLWLATIMLKVSLWWYKLTRTKAGYFVGSSNYVPIAYEKNRLMQSETRYQLFMQTYSQHPNLQLGGVTSQWVFNALQAIEEIQTMASSISIPALVLKAGDDSVVSNGAIDAIAAALPKVTYQTVERARHELLFEKDDIRTRTLNSIEAFLHN